MRLTVVVTAIIMLLITSYAAQAQCTPHWARGLFPSGDTSDIRNMCVYNGELYACGVYEQSAKEYIKTIVKWNGTTWTPVGSPSLIKSYRFCGMYVYRNELYVSGSYITMNGVSMNNIARWDGSSWSHVGSGVNNEAGKFIEYNGDLYVSGLFTAAGDIPASGIAKWNGAEWQPVGSGIIIDGCKSYISEFCVYQNDLYAAGIFKTGEGVLIKGVAKWNGTTWESLGVDLTGFIVGIRCNTVHLGIQAHRQ